jgi:hypothetical protein
VRGRIIRLLRRHDIDLEGSSSDGPSDLLALESPVMAQIQGASVLGRVATGPRAGQRVLRLGRDPTAPVVTTGGPRHAHIEGFDLHANTAVSAGANARLENLCGTILRPPVPHAPLPRRLRAARLLPQRPGRRRRGAEPDTESSERFARHGTRTQCRSDTGRLRATVVFPVG